MMGQEKRNGPDRKSLLDLLDLLERAALERDAVSQLLLSGGSGQGPSVALHAYRSWHAIATVQARLSGDTDPDFETFTLDEDSEILAPIAQKKRADCIGSLAKVREAALVEPWYGEAGRAELEDLRRQIQLLGSCISAQRRRVISSTGGGLGFRFGWRQLLIAASALVLAIIVVDLGARLVRGLQSKAAVENADLGLPSRIRADLSDLRDFKPRGSSWDGTGNVIIDQRLRVSLGGILHPDMLSVSLDGNDRYNLRFMAGDKEVGIASVGPSEVEGLEVYNVVVPIFARSHGFDHIVIEVSQGDGAQSVGHLLLNEPAQSDESDSAP